MREHNDVKLNMPEQNAKCRDARAHIMHATKERLMQIPQILRLLLGPHQLVNVIHSMKCRVDRTVCLMCQGAAAPCFPSQTSAKAKASRTTAVWLQVKIECSNPVGNTGPLSFVLSTCIATPHTKQQGCATCLSLQQSCDRGAVSV